MPIALPRVEQNNSDLLSLIGNTPLIRITSAEFPGVEVYAKAEFFNPGGSVKDRPALNMIVAGELSEGSWFQARCCWTRPVGTPA